jgi:hypothetical protein
MGIAQVSQKIQSGVEGSGHQWKASMNVGNNKRWTGAVAAGSLITGAILLAMGRRRAGLAVTAAGTVIALLEDPDSVTAVWNRLPSYLQTGKHMLNRFETFVAELSEQGDKIRSLLAKPGQA